MENLQENKDQLLWEEARERVRFRKKVMTYIVFSAFFWAIWYMTEGRDNDSVIDIKDGRIPWPAWAMLGWGIGLIFRYIRIHHTSDNKVEEEYRKLKEKRGK